MNTNNKSDFNFPIAAMIVMGVLGAIVVSLCFKVINYWPQPVSVAPYFGGKMGLVWGLIVGAINGLVLGFLTDDKYFEKTT